MKYTPTPQQVEDSDLMLEYNNALVWSMPGTGKTLTAMEAARKGGYTRICVLAPKIALSMWWEELNKHLGVTAYILRTGRIPKGFWFLGCNALITTHDLAGKHSEMISKWQFGGYVGGTKEERGEKSVLILDEAHYYKSTTSKRTMAVFGNGHVRGLAGRFDDVWQLTGTPMTRHADDLWIQLQSARPEIMEYYGVSTKAAFINEFCTTKSVRYSTYGPPTITITGTKNHAKLEKLISACKVIRRDVDPDLPAVFTHIIDIPLETGFKLGKINMSHEQLVKELADPDSPMSKTRKLLGMAKVPGIAEYVKEHGKTPVLVGMWHRDAITALRDLLIGEGLNVAVLTGDTPFAEREAYQKQFNAGLLDVLIGQMRAMREAINLQECSRHVIIGEEDPSPATISQFVARVHRKGQKNRVDVDVLRSAHDLDAALYRIREEKQHTIERVIK